MRNDRCYLCGRLRRLQSRRESHARLIALRSQATAESLLIGYRSRLAGGYGIDPIVGDLDLIAREFDRVSAAGFEGATPAFVNYLDEAALEVLPRLAAMGSRVAVRATPMVLFEETHER